MNCLIPRRSLLLGSLALAACSTSRPQGERMMDLKTGQLAQQLSISTAGGARSTARFWLYLPPGYDKDGPAWPLVFFLHGSGERGTELAAVKRHGPPKLIEQGQQFPFVLVSPQLGEDRDWDPGELQALSLALQAQLRVDPRRITVTGMSRGGNGCWRWASAFPDQLAAIAPVCGYGLTESVCALRAVPVRAYHGAADTVVPLAAHRALVEALQACGGQADLTVYPGVGHDSWNPAYADPALYAWLMAQRLP